MQDAGEGLAARSPAVGGNADLLAFAAIDGAVEHTKTKDAGKKLAQSLFNELTNDLVKNALTDPLETALQPMFKGLTSLITKPRTSALTGVPAARRSVRDGWRRGSTGAATR